MNDYANILPIASTVYTPSGEAMEQIVFPGYLCQNQEHHPLMNTASKATDLFICLIHPNTFTHQQLDEIIKQRRFVSVNYIQNKLTKANIHQEITNSVTQENPNADFNVYIRAPNRKNTNTTYGQLPEDATLNPMNSQKYQEMVQIFRTNSNVNEQTSLKNPSNPKKRECCLIQ